MGTTFNQELSEDIPRCVEIKSCKSLFVVLLIMNANYVLWGFCVASISSSVTCGAVVKFR